MCLLQLDSDSLKGTGKPKRDLIVPRQRRTRILADVEAFVERESVGNGLYYPSFADRFAVDRQDAVAAFSSAAAIVREFEPNLMLARSQRTGAVDVRDLLL